MLEKIPDNEKALGVFWNTEDGKVGIQVHMKEKPLTRRGMLPSLSSICDTLGLAAPFMLEGRRVIQSLCHQNLDWYEQIPDSMAKHLVAWKSNLLLLEYIEVQDVLNPRNFVKLENKVCWFFSDASEYGYGHCSYLRMVDENDQIHCSPMTIG